MQFIKITNLILIALCNILCFIKNKVHCTNAKNKKNTSYGIKTTIQSKRKH